MKFMLNLSLSVLLTGSGAWAAEMPASDSPNGIRLPTNYKDWKVIGSSHREDNQTLRIIVGNGIAVKAARNGKTHPWPDGSTLGKLVWKDEIHPDWAKAIVPGEFVHAEFMVKDSAKYPETGGWGFARWLGMNQTPYGKDKTFVQECWTCHVQVKDNDSVFTRPAPLP